MGFLLFMEFGGARSRNGCTARDIQPRAAAKLSYGSYVVEAPDNGQARQRGLMTQI